TYSRARKPHRYSTLSHGRAAPPKGKAEPDVVFPSRGIAPASGPAGKEVFCSGLALTPPCPFFDSGSGATEVCGTCPGSSAADAATITRPPGSTAWPAAATWVVARPPRRGRTGASGAAPSGQPTPGARARAG